MHKFCSPIVKGYEVAASQQSDAAIDTHLFRYYPVLNPSQRKDPMYRKWRRCVIVEALKRGLITKDPGHEEPERG